MKVPYTRKQVRKAIVALVGAIVGLLAHYDVVVGDAVGDAILVFDLLLTPFFVFRAENEPAPDPAPDQNVNWKP